MRLWVKSMGRMVTGPWWRMLAGLVSAPPCSSGTARSWPPPRHHHRGGLHPVLAGPAHPATDRRDPRPEQRLTDTITSHTPTLLTHRGSVPIPQQPCSSTPTVTRPATQRGSFAALGSIGPQQVFSGKTTRHRLNRGGDRQANAALDRIALSCLRWDARTRDYLARRITEGKPVAKPSAASSDTSPARSIRSSPPT